MKKIFAFIAFVLFVVPGFSQINMDTSTHHQPSQKDTLPMHDMNNMDMHDMDMNNTSSHQMQHGEMMSSSFSRNLPMNRNGSGTAWLPDASPMYGSMYHSKHWMYMLHGNLFLRYNEQDFTGKGSRGGSRFDAPDWLMFMGQRKVGEKGLFHFGTMFSLDAAIANNGYPLLFQSGESYKGKPIVDRQHPHDLFSELSVSYAHAFSKKADAFVYLAYPGEPALGPVAFMHRPSALNNPNAPISHHWSDATHITFGVATIGVRYGQFKIEGSSFTGREPDEHRFNFDKPRFDSWSGRLSFNPDKHWALQVSHGFIKSPELLHPEEDIHRTTASAIYSTTFSNNTIFNAAVIWGMNKAAAHSGEHSLLTEASIKKNKLDVYLRHEWVQKSIEELNLDETVYGHNIVFPVNEMTLGINYDLMHLKKTNVAAGAQYTLFTAPSTLNNLYGNNPMSFEVYIRIYPSIMRM